MEILRKLIQKRNKEVSFLSGVEAQHFSEEMGREVRGIMRVTPPSPDGGAQIHKVQKRVYMQVALAVSSILLIVVLIFAMTVAWYTNVAKTGSMTFRAESWGFDSEKIRLSESGIAVFPGTSGVIPLTVDNSDSASALRIGVTVSKETGMEKDLQKRIFFYADTQKTYEFPQTPQEEAGEPQEEAGEPEILTETVSRVYLSDLEAYSYTVPGGQSLVMTGEYCNDAPLKWEWVYDMLGYYFRGTVKDNAVTEVEYLRPIEYDYTGAVFGRDQTAGTYGQLLSVNGVKKEELLEQLSAADGYEGVIDPENFITIDRENDPAKHLYYPVQVDENGYGIWAYLCTLEEIEGGIAYDTALAESETPPAIEATVTLTAANVSAHTAPAATAEALQALLTAPESADNIITLEQDITLTGSVALGETADARLDLNGYTLTLGADGTKAAELQVGEGQKLTLLNGTVRWDPQAEGEYVTTAIRSAGGSIVLGNVTLEGFNDAIRIEDQTQDGDTILQITGSEIEAERIAVFVQGNGSRSDTPTRVIIQDSHINGKSYIGICGQGSEDRWGTELVILNSTVEGKWAGLYQPQQQAVTTVSNSTIIGGTGLVVKGGTVTVTDSTVRGTGAAQPAKADGSGFTDTGDGIYVEAVYNWPASVIVKGSNTKVYSDHSRAVELFGAAGKGPGKVMLYDGTYSGTLTAANAHWNEIGTFEIFGGNYTGAVDSTILRHGSTPGAD